MSKKLSKAQQVVIDALASGEWELGKYYHGSYWLQKGGLGQGGKVKWISPRTIKSLMRLGLVETHFVQIFQDSFPTSKVTLKEKGVGNGLAL